MNPVSLKQHCPEKDYKFKKINSMVGFQNNLLYRYSSLGMEFCLNKRNYY